MARFLSFLLVLFCFSEAVVGVAGSRVQLVNAQELHQQIPDVGIASAAHSRFDFAQTGGDDHHQCEGPGHHCCHFGHCGFASSGRMQLPLPDLIFLGGPFGIDSLRTVHLASMGKPPRS